MPSIASIQFIDDHWSSFLGCQTSDIYNNQTLVVPHAGLGNYRGALLFRRGPSCIVSVPAAMLDKVEDRIGEAEPDEVFNEIFLQRLFADSAERIIGPAQLSCADATDFHPPEEPHETRLLTAVDDGALRRLAAACGDTDWEHSGIRFGEPPIFGCFDGMQLVAAGSAEQLGVRLLNVGIVSHPAYRGQGYGRSVASAVTQHGLEQGHIMQYRTLYSNQPSLRIARSLGYHEYAATLAVRLRA